MSNEKPIRVVQFQSFRFVGTTWLTMLAGNHEEAFALGNPDRTLDSIEKKKPVCCICPRSKFRKSKCSFWPEMLKDYNPSENFFTQLAAASGKEVLVISNPRDEAIRAQLEDSRLQVETVELIRDFRAIISSHKRKHGDSVAGIFNDWFARAALKKAIQKGDAASSIIRYEDAVRDSSGLVSDLSKLTGLDLGEKALRYWEGDHHMGSGNGNTHRTVQAFKSVGGALTKLDPIYRGYIERVTEGKDDASFVDERWRKELERYDLFVIDVLVGSINEERGYQRDEFSEEEKVEFASALDAELAKMSIEPPFRRLLKRAGNEGGDS
jgi:hypothetical protein